MSERQTQEKATRGQAVSAQRRRRDRAMLLIGAALGLAFFALLVAL